MTNRRWFLGLILTATYLAVWAGILDASGLSWGTLEAWTQDPMGAEFRVNSYTTGNQLRPAVAADAQGNFVVVWQNLGQDGSYSGVFGRQFSASGVAQGFEFRANSFTVNHPQSAAVTSGPNGDFVVVWVSLGQDGSLSGIFGQRFSASGLPQGSEFQVNSYTPGHQSAPAVASAANGDFVVVWISSDQSANSSGFFGQRFNASGVPQGSEFQVNPPTSNLQSGPEVASAANGDFVVVWYRLGQDGSNWGVFGQRLDASGLPRGSEFQVNSFTTGIQFGPAVASDPNGNFVVTWFSDGQDGSGFGVFGQRFDASGVPQGSEFQVNSYTAGTQYEPKVASDANGNFVVAWQSNGQDGSGWGVFGRRFNAAGVPQGSEFQVNTFTTSTQSLPKVASAANGNFVVVWQGVAQDGSSYGILGQRFGDLIFKDGFE